MSTTYPASLIGKNAAAIKAVSDYPGMVSGRAGKKGDTPFIYKVEVVDMSILNISVNMSELTPETSFAIFSLTV